jgi:taurine transport system substrate-binding protein
MKQWFGAALAAGALLFGSADAWAQSKTLTIAYQDMMNPWRVAMANKEVEKETGYTINWRQFGGGGDVIRAMASGDIQVGEAGSAAVATAASQGIDVELFWILEDIGAAEALIVKPAIKTPQELKGKRIATPFVSTSHYQLMFALETWGVKPNELQVLNMRPADIGAAWQRGDLDGAFIWDPVLAQAKKNGHVLITSAQVGEMGRPTFDGMVVTRKFAKANPDFMVKLVKILARNDAAYVANKAGWTVQSPQIQAVAKISGAKAEDVPDGMALYGFPSLADQASAKWLGGGKDGGAAKALAATATFLKEQGRIEKVLPDYRAALTPYGLTQAAENNRT